MKTLYLDCGSGVSGDMTVAALLDLGADRDALLASLESLGVDGYTVEITRVRKNGVDACDFHVLLDTGAAQPARNLHDIRRIIDGSAITDGAKQLAHTIFTVAAEAAAKVHALPVDEVFFHEDGAVDSIVDIVSAAVCVDNLGVARVLCSPLCEGSGTVRCRHGVIPVPAPATLEIVRAHGIPLHITDVAGELVTPTGAAIVAALADSFEPPSGFTVRRVGYGAGKRDYPTAGVVRAMLIEAEDMPNRDEVVELSCNLDDMTGELLAHACGLLLDAGALDVWCTPIQMKKGRPAQLLSVLAAPADAERFTALLLTHTTTLGVRQTLHSRTVMRRRQYELETRFGKVTIKESSLGKICKNKVEYESAKRLSEATNTPVNQILSEAYSRLNTLNLKD